MFAYPIASNLSLRLLTAQDANALFHLTDTSRLYLREWLPWVDSTKTPADTLQFIHASLQQFGANNGFNAAIWYDNRMAGCVGLHHVDWPNRCTSLGYWLGAEFQGLGIMTRAAAAVTAIVFQHYKLNRVELHAASGNYKSQKVAERLGFQREGLVRQAEWLYDHFVDHIVYAMLRDDWNAQSSL